MAKKVNGATTRENQVLELAAEGLSDKEIARRLGISPDTVETYWRRIRSRTGANSRTEAVARAFLEKSKASEAIMRRLIEELVDRMGIEDAVGATSYETVHQALAAGRPRGGGWPVLASPIFGRSQEVLSLTEAAASRNGRLVTILGVGGCGKTRLAVEFGERMEPFFRQWRWFVDLSAVSDPSRIPIVLIQSLGLSESPSAMPLDQVANCLRRLSSPCLLALDCLELLVAQDRSSVVSIVQGLLEQVPNLRIVATSRTPLRASAEICLELLPLPVPLADPADPTFADNPSVRLFVHRIEGILPDFRLTPINAGAVAGICRRLEGLPLSLEIAASRARSFSLAELERSLGNRMEALTPPLTATRSDSLEGSIGWSYALLPPETQRFFDHLGLFRGSFTAAAAAFLGSSPDPCRHLETLSEMSLLRAEEKDGRRRFRMLDTIAEFAHCRLRSSGELEGAEDRLLDYV